MSIPSQFPKPVPLTIVVNAPLSRSTARISALPPQFTMTALPFSVSTTIPLGVVPVFPTSVETLMSAGSVASTFKILPELKSLTMRIPFPSFPIPFRKLAPATDAVPICSAVFKSYARMRLLSSTNNASPMTSIPCVACAVPKYSQLSPKSDVDSIVEEPQLTNHCDPFGSYSTASIFDGVCARAGVAIRMAIKAGRIVFIGLFFYCKF